MSLLFSSLADALMHIGLFNVLVLSLILVTLFFVAWKYPSKTKYIGSLGLCVSVFLVLVKSADILYSLIKVNGNIHPNLVCAALRSFCIMIAYGILIYAISLLIRLFTKEPSEKKSK